MCKILRQFVALRHIESPRIVSIIFWLKAISMLAFVDAVRSNHH